MLYNDTPPRNQDPRRSRDLVGKYVLCSFATARPVCVGPLYEENEQDLKHRAMNEAMQRRREWPRQVVRI